VLQILRFAALHHELKSCHLPNFQSKTDASKLKLKKPDFSDSDLDDVEVVDLAQDPSATSYENFAPREYRKLHTLHASVQKQKDKNVRLPKVKPQFAYTSGEQPHLSFLQKNEEIDDIFDGEDFRDDEDFPSPSALFKGDHGRDVSRSFKPIAESPIKDVDAPTSSIWDDSLESLEAGMIGLSDSMMLRLPSPKINTSFANGVFDFDAFSNHKDDQEKSTSPHTKASMEEDRVPSPVTKESRKRERSASLELQMKRPRTMEEAQTEKSNPQSSIPSWVDEFDSDLIDGLKGFVDFVD
jgi:ATP-dependent DNA helicase HFM1/MER3